CWWGRRRRRRLRCCAVTCPIVCNDSPSNKGDLMRKLEVVILCILFTAAVAWSQETAKKPLSPPAKAEATLNGKKITIDYSAPSKRDRVIMGGLVPYGQVWRTGANAATTLTTEADLTIGSLQVPKGTYTLY